ncbi:hypothetical protein Jiend_11300 [Micromonospora endophytica]|nr:hypothetical protein Jiend_11300 [Micromonospora endophytica]
MPPAVAAAAAMVRAVLRRMVVRMMVSPSVRGMTQRWIDPVGDHGAAWGEIRGTSGGGARASGGM